jgi:hypothetical protein
VAIKRDRSDEYVKTDYTVINICRIAIGMDAIPNTLQPKFSDKETVYLKELCSQCSILDFLILMLRR